VTSFLAIMASIKGKSTFGHISETKTDRNMIFESNSMFSGVWDLFCLFTNSSDSKWPTWKP
jgi:hypothetical protein